MSEQANAVLPVPEAAGFAADWENLLRAAPAIQDMASADAADPDRVEIPRSHLITEAVALLTRQGWDVKVAMSQNAQLEKRRPLRPAVGAVIICLFSVPGMLMVMQQIANARRERIHLQVRDGQLEVLYAGRSVKISDPGELEHIVQRHSAGMTYGLAAALGLATLVFWVIVLLSR